MEDEVNSQIKALRDAQQMGCSGAHVAHNGEWMPCSSFGEYKSAVLRIEGTSRIATDEIVTWNSRRKKKGKKAKKRFENLRERGINGIQSTEGGGLVSAPSSGPIMTKSITGPYSPRDNDVDVFSDIESARARSRQIGCIGVSRRVSKNGKVVWMPCTNMTDYANVSGTTALGRRNQQEQRNSVVRTVLREVGKKRKKSLAYELHEYKSIGRSLSNSARSMDRFDPTAIDADGDMVVQEGTPFQRPATPSVKPIEKLVVKPFKVENNGGPAWFASLSEPQKIEQFGAPSDFIEHAKPRDREKIAKIFTPASGLKSSSMPKVENSNATQNNPYAELGGKTMGGLILGQVKAEQKNKPKRKMYFIGGTTGAGKGETVKHLQEIGIIPKDDEAAHIDPDFIKLGLPGYNDGKGASRVHETSRAATDYVIRDAQAGGMDTIIQGTGKRTEHLGMARKNGDATVGHFVYAPTDIAEERQSARGKETGRDLPSYFPGLIAGEIPAYVSQMFERDLLDEFYLWDNSGDMTKGQKPKLIAQKTPGKPMIVHDREKFDAFAQSKKTADRWEKAANERDAEIKTTSSQAAD
jgi:hypothetical protein